MTPEELAALDLEVARAEGIKLVNGLIPDAIPALDFNGNRFPDDPGGSPYQPTRDWIEAGRLMVKYDLDVRKRGDGWISYPSRPPDMNAYILERSGALTKSRGPTPQVAICRAVVAIAGAQK
jgi:hypothetical protein